ncbi:hypothetical protein V1L54_21625 [Streptomyces sp. TRM 70361]|nr:hypothetical protein [Streptomyces sp. TRM 70361]MEE1941969.1 hypothetical protein [Streptomyces sp. TRM 70361]
MVVEDASQTGPLADQELVRGGGADRAANGGAADLQFAGDTPQAHPFADQLADGCMLSADSAGSTP